tara:strand:- start:131 stop:349 length:219 start_codon:yes stop_codon:yes gene_type:complete
VTAVVLWIIVKALFAIGVSVAVICWMMFTKDGRIFLAWMVGIGAAMGVAALIPVLMGAAFLWLLYYILMIFL